jgi:cytochrome c oxidase subunit 1
MFGGVYFWFPKMAGRMINETWGKIGFWLNFIGVNVTFWPLFIIGIEGMPRRYYDYAMNPEWEWGHQIATYGAFTVAAGMTITILTWIYGAVAGPKAEQNPWKSKSLEWTHAPTPPGPGNFDPMPVVDENWTPYNYPKNS